MKAIIIGLLIAMIAVLYPARLQAKMFWASPRPGEGPIQIAERYGVEPTYFIQVNRELGSFTYPKKPSLIYTWQKFLVVERGEDYSLLKTFKNPLKMAQYSTGKKEQPKSSDIKQGVVPQLKPQKSLPPEKQVSYVIFFEILLLTILVCLVLVLIKGKRYKNLSFQLEGYIISFSTNLASYCISSYREPTKVRLMNTLEETAAETADLSVDYIKENFERIFASIKDNGKKGKGIWRELTKSEKEFLRDYTVSKLSQFQIKDPDS